MHKVHYVFGYTEARMKFPLGKKIWAAFWTIEERLAWGAEFDIADSSEVVSMMQGGASVSVTLDATGAMTVNQSRLSDNFDECRTLCAARSDARTTGGCCYYDWKWYYC